MWHIDITVIRLLDGTKAYLQAIIDNYSRRILAWRLGTQLEAVATSALLVKAFKGKEGDESQSLFMVSLRPYCWHFVKKVQNVMIYSTAVNKCTQKGDEP